jgi:hypothetical protein
MIGSYVCVVHRFVLPSGAKQNDEQQKEEKYRTAIG